MREALQSLYKSIQCSKENKLLLLLLLLIGKIRLNSRYQVN